MVLHDAMFGPLLLDNANLSQHESLMVVTSIGNQTELDKATDRFMLRHSRIHMPRKEKETTITIDAAEKKITTNNSRFMEGKGNDYNNTCRGEEKTIITIGSRVVY